MEKLREKIYARVCAGDKIKDIAANFGVSKKTIYKVKNVYGASGNFNDKTRSGRPRSVRSEAFIESVQTKIKENPRTNIRSLAKDLKVDKMAVSRTVRFDLGMKSRAVTKVQGLTTTQREKRLKRCKALLNKMKKGENGVLVFSDEKIFTVDAVSNSRSLRYIAKSPSDVDPSIKFTGRTKHPAWAMMLGIVGSDGKAFPPVWIQETLSTPQYKSILSRKVFPILNATYGVGNWVWTQDGAPCHTSNATQKYLEAKLGSKGFWSKELWPPNSPNLNPLDYYVWSAIERKACRTYHKNVGELKASVEAEWASMDEATLRKVCSKFRSRLEACIKAEGGIFEK